MKFIVKNDLGGCNFSELCRLVEEYQHISVSTSCLRKRLFAEGMLSMVPQRSWSKNECKSFSGLLFFHFFNNI
jgi:hypothetical protein